MAKAVAESNLVASFMTCAFRSPVTPAAFGHGPQIQFRWKRVPDQPMQPATTQKTVRDPALADPRHSG